MLKTIKLRPAALRDSAELLRWRNQASARRHFFNSREVARLEHDRWFKKKLSDPSTLLYVIESAKGQGLGQLRLDRLKGGRAEISISVDSRARGKGVGLQALCAAASLAKRKGLRRLVAHIKPGNPASLAAFLKGGFTLKKLTRVQKQTCFSLEKPL